MYEIRCKLNPCAPCAANEIINTKQCALLLHADDIKASCTNPKINSKFAKWAKLTHRSDKLGHAKVHRGKKHNCLGATMNYLTRGAFKVDITDYVDAMNKDFPHETNKTLKT